MRILSSLSKSASILPALFLLGACTTEKIVEVEKPAYNPPADAASGFLGYYTASEGQTTCGNCHADYQAAWQETAHAHAYATLKANAGNQPFCFSCHTVSANGNVANGTAGWDKVQDSTYHDVQCESCHGPGQQHVDGVNAGNLVIPKANMGQGAKEDEPGGLMLTADTAASCASCHTGEHHPYVEQWSESRHALVRQAEVQRAAPNSCAPCHEGRGALKAWGVKETWAEGPYKETDPMTKMQPTTCVVCHDPHDARNEGQLRFPINSTDPTQNLCIKCHLRQAYPTAGSSRGNAPHGAQGAVLLGFAGWRPPNFTYDTARVYGSHASPTANTKLCAGCHVSPFTVTDASGTFQLQSVGHLFRPAPCLDATGHPVEDNTCAYSGSARNWSSCTKSGCHADKNVAANVFNASRSEMHTLVLFLWTDKNLNKVIDAYPTDDGYLARIKQNTGDLNASAQPVTAADGMEFNVRMCGEKNDTGTDHPDGSYGTHNSFLCRALLSQGTTYLKSIYAFLPSPPAEVAAVMAKWDGRTRPAGLIVSWESFPVMNR